jgi:hypothetical protein
MLYALHPPDRPFSVPLCSFLPSLHTFSLVTLFSLSSLFVPFLVPSAPFPLSLFSSAPPVGSRVWLVRLTILRELGSKFGTLDGEAVLKLVDEVKAVVVSFRPAKQKVTKCFFLPPAGLNFCPCSIFEFLPGSCSLLFYYFPFNFVFAACSCTLC